MTVGSGLSIAQTEKNTTVQNQVISQLIQGRSNAVGETTLTASATSTVVDAPNCGPQSCVFLSPVTAHAAAIVAYVSSVSAGSFTITHTSNANTDKTFRWVALG